jgi:hypothetical protein
MSADLSPNISRQGVIQPINIDIGIETHPL